jgi:hypothetical protein
MLGVRPAGVWCFVLLLAACRGGGDEVPEDVSQQSAETPVEAFFRYGPVAYGGDRAELQRTLGSPDSVTAASVANRHDASVTDSVFTLHYPGITIGIYRASYDGRELLESVAITDDRHLRPESPLRLGLAEDEIRLLLGEPDAVAEGTLQYSCSTCDAAGHDLLELELGRSGLRRITLEYWLD